VIVNASGKIEIANSQAERLFEYSKQKLIGMRIEQLMPSKFAKKHVQHRHRFFTQPKLREMGNDIKVFALTKRGKEIPIEVSLSPIETEHGQLVSAAIRDIRQRQRSDEALRLAKNTAESALAAKSRFLATASHDLRQPLHSLTLLNKALLKSIDKPEAKKMLGMQGDSLFTMARLLNTLLDISKLESGTVAAQPSHFALRPMLEKLCAGFEVEAYENGLVLTLEANDNHVVYSDPGLLNQLLQNLLANAIRYTKVGKVTIACSQKHNILKVSIIDTGIGIPADQLIYIFDEFHQVNRNPQQHHGGLGLGLSIVQLIADLLGTQVNVTSKVGLGSTFSISLPLGKSTLSTVSEKETNTDQAIEKKVLILLVDDDPDVLDASEMLLSMEQCFDIVCASSPPEAYAQLDKQLPDLIITDFHLNHKESGLDIIHKAKTKEGHQIPAILVSGDTSPEMETITGENLQLMTKPVNPDELILQAYRLLAKEK
jgi:two-component system CheB/CheR fusion protein